ncbi:hypothetical protein CMU00_15955 [Elizabethkingia anophelis]|nr:hypothetical protein [Elizabethkingia anophelis]
MIRIFYFFILGILMFSCTEDNVSIKKVSNSENAKSVFYKIYNSEAKNHLLIENLNGIYDKNSISNISSRSLDGSPVSLSINGNIIEGTVKLAGKVGVWQSSSLDVKSLFGNTILLKKGSNGLIASIASNKTASINGIQEDGLTIYMPEIISASISGLENGNVVPGTVVTWNRDMRNLNGVAIMMDYNPYQQTDMGIVKDISDFESRFIEVEDIGSYTVTENDLRNFPSGTNLSFYIGRSAYSINSDNTISTIGDTSIGAITAVRADFKISY